MRTTLTLPDDVYRVARSVAAAQDVSLGEAIAILVRRGLEPPMQIDTSKPFPCFPARPDDKPITTEDVLAAEADER
jgi:hypothetical protein